MDFNFEKIDYLYFLIFGILIFIFSMGYRKKRTGFQFLKIKFNNKLEIIKIIGMILGLFFIILSLLEPKIMKGTVSSKKEGLDIYVLIDVSSSMDAEDIKPRRMDRAKYSILSLINSLKGDRIGFIPFSSDAYIQLPLTDDYGMAKLFLEVVDTDMIYGGGTNIEKAIETAVQSFDKTAKGDKVIIVFSDGEEHDNKAIEISKKTEDIKIYTVGVGTIEGSLIPEYINKIKRGYKKDRNGNNVITKLNTSTLKEIADYTKGKFYLSTLKGDEIEKLVDDISKLKIGEYKENEIKIYRHLFQYFLSIGLVLFVLFYFLYIPEFKANKKEGKS